MERVTSDLKYKSKGEENQLNDAKNLFENERRKSVGIEEAAARLQKEHAALTEELEVLRREVRQT